MWEVRRRGAGSILQSEGKLSQALRTVEEGLDDIKAFFGRFGQEEAYGRSNEVRVLRQFARRIRKKLPVNPVTRLQKKLEKAVKSERYEEAAQLRDKILRMQAPTNPGSESPNRA
jgi:excinuclease UvrABC helicase subunit UvrB